MRIWYWGVPIILLLTGCGTGAAVPTESPASASTSLPALDPAEIDLGQEVYIVHCASCHGLSLEGEANWQLPNEDGSFRAPPHDASGHTWHHSDQVLLEAIRLGGARIPPSLGTSHMPAYEGVLTEAEMQAVITYFKSAWPDDIRARQWEITAAGTR